MRFGILCLCLIAIVNQSRVFAQEDEASQEMLEAMKSARFSVPDIEPEELVAFLKNLGELRADLSNEYRSLTARITEAQTLAAEKILEQPDGVSDAVYYEAAKFVVPIKISSLAKSTPRQQQETMELVVRQLNIGLGRGLSSVDVNSAYQLVSYLERYGDPMLAKEAAVNCARILKQDNNPSFARSISSIEAIAKRLSVLGSDINIKGESIDGTEFDWSEYRGKVVLVDFWATWCGPCLAEAPNVKQNYELYHDRGFEVVGISLDSDKDQLKAYLEKSEIPWVNLFEDGAGWKHPLAVEYGVRSIPSAWLVDRTGKVVSMNARGATLSKELTRLLGPPTGKARDFAVEGQWAQVTQSMQEFVQKNSHMKYRKGLAAAQLKQGDEDSYGETCLAAWNSKADLDIWQQGGVVVVCSLAPSSGIDGKELADFANQIDENSTHAYMRMFKCMAAFRAGRYEDCSPVVLKGEEYTECVTKLFCAMASQQSGNSSEAKRLFSEASKLIEQDFSDMTKIRSNPNKKDHWIECAILDLLKSEAEIALTKPSID